MNKTFLRIIKRKLKPRKTAADRAWIKLFSINITEGDVAIDCGANVGDVSAHWAKTGATIYAFEPNPHAFNILEGRFASLKNVHCFQKAVLNRNEKVKLYFHTNSDEDELYWSQGTSLLLFKSNILKDKFKEVDAIDLTEFIQQLNRNIKVLKLDVEGVESSILRKIIEKDLHKRIEYIFAETHDDRVPELRAETDELRALIKDMHVTNINLDYQ